MIDVAIILLIIALCLLAALCFCNSDNRKLRKALGEQSIRLTNYNQVVRWCAAYQIDAMDLDAFVHGRRTKAMVRWEDKNGKSTLAIENFREYVKSVQVVG